MSDLAQIDDKSRANPQAPASCPQAVCAAGCPRVPTPRENGATPADAPTSHRGLTANHSAKNREGAMNKPTQNRRPMTSDDPRHGSNAGAVAHWKLGEKPCDPCAQAAFRHRKARRRTRSLIPIAGARRRIQALHAIGYSVSDLAAYLNVAVGTLSGWSYRSDLITVKNHNAIDAMFRHLCMTPNQNADKRTINNAIRKAYAPPLAWDDIDADPAPCIYTDTTDLIDEVRVQRVLNGIRQDCTPAERLAVIDQWTGTQKELERITGWNVRRILNDRKAAA